MNRAAHHIQRAKNVYGLAESLDYIFSTTFDASKEDGRWITTHGRAQVERLNNFSVQIYANEHPPPHFHIRGGGIDACLAIETFEALEGWNDVPKNAKRLIRYFYESGGREKLIQFWNESRPEGCEVGPIQV